MDNLIKIYICDDNSVFNEKIKAIIDKIVGKHRKYTIMSFTDGQDLIEAFQKQKADVVFLDINMPFINGFDVAKALQKTCPDVLIIFITNYEDKVYQSWAYQPFWFVRKTHLNDLKIVLPKMIAKIDSERDKKKHYFNLQAENRIVEININTLTLIESLRHNLIIKHRDSEPVCVRCKMSVAEEQLFPLHIVRVQKGILVNCRYISKITCREVIMLDGSKINIGRKRISNVREQFQKYLRSI